MATDAPRRPGRSLRYIFQLGKEFVADLDALPAHAEAWIDQERDREAAEPARRTGSREEGLATRPDPAEPQAGALDWWTDPSATLVPSQDRRAIRRVQAHLGWRRLLG